MLCRLTELQCREVIGLSDGARLGTVGDVEVDTETGRAAALVLLPKWSLFGGGEERIVRWEDVEQIGEEYILARRAVTRPRRQRKAAEGDPSAAQKG